MAGVLSNSERVCYLPLFSREGNFFFHLRFLVFILLKEAIGIFFTKVFNILFLAVIGNLAIFDSNKKQLVKYGVLPPLVKLAKQPEEIEQISKTHI